MTTLSDERLAFMRQLGITEEDVLDPFLITSESDKNNKSPENDLGCGAVREGSRGSAACKTSKGEFQGAQVPEYQSKVSHKGRVSHQSVNRYAGCKEVSPEKLKVDGNRAFEDGRYREALNCYTEAIEILLGMGDYQLKGDSYRKAEGVGVVEPRFSQSDPIIVLLAALFSNRSACYIQAAKQIGTAEALESAIRDADRAVELRPAWFKGYSRQGDAFFKMKKYAQAAEAYEMALQLDPGNNNLLLSVREARERSADETRNHIRAAKKHAAPTSTKVNAASDAIASVAMFASKDVSFKETPSGRRNSGQLKTTARQLWNEFKHEVEASVHQPTGDDYRREQLRLYREQKERDRNGFVPVPSSGHRKNDDSFIKETQSEEVLPDGTGPVKGTFPRKERPDYVPEEYSSDAAAAYQQRLLEEYRRKKAKQL
ncbi:stress-induced protein sti1 [Trypanosoma theileri]|uniref:Stress-induced protein sti1 n=1 Tax=Trypanosoma theileri TaxID=67003 RepID=A0A1X0NJW2_9TRYP|nr:stress-induced protein sti1 [Trypanosoma theileri]ORC84947.1 stress-induced protein sti1 [Trypanosoma theileri]